MERRELMLAALSAGSADQFSPVQLQKLFFLIDKKVPHAVGGPHFNFRPYNYGPFDDDIYRELRTLADAGLVSIDASGRFATYALTPAGREAGAGLLAQLGPAVDDYLSRLSSWVRQQSFAQLVSAIYREYPDMRANSVFHG